MKPLKKCFFFVLKEIALNLERGVWQFLVIVLKKRVVTSALTAVKHGWRSSVIYFCMNQGTAVYANFLLLRLLG